MRFEKKIADIRRAFVSTSVENVSGLEASATDMQSFLQESTKRIAVLKERAQNLAAERPLHHVAIELLVLCPCLWCVLAPHLTPAQVDNGRLRGVVNDYTEGLVTETLSRWDMSKGEGPSAKPGAFRMCF